jgi:predicted transcriptional regulator
LLWDANNGKYGTTITKTIGKVIVVLVAKKYLDYHMTHQEIANELGISRQMVRVIEYRALQKLKRSGKLRAFLDHINDEREERYGKVLSWIILTTRGRKDMGRNTRRYVKTHKPRSKSTGNSDNNRISKKRRRVVY